MVLKAGMRARLLVVGSEAAGRVMVWEVGGGEVEMVEDDCRGGICLLSSISISYIYIGARQPHMLKSKWISFEDKLDI